MISSIGRVIQLFFVKGDPSGMVTATIPFQWSGHVLVSKRLEIADALQRPEAERPGVYMLVDENQSKVYIGESDNIRDRITQHVKDEDKDWWSVAILITSTGDSINKAHGRYLECRLYKKVKHLGMIALDNKQSPSEQTLSEPDTASMDAFLENIYLVLPALKFDFLVERTKSNTLQDNQISLDDFVRFCFIENSTGINASARIENGQFIVEAGSIARQEWNSRGYEHTAPARLFNNLVERGILRKEDNFRVFVEDCIFGSTSSAASVIAGASRSGPKSWKVKGSEKTYSEWEKEAL